MTWVKQGRIFHLEPNPCRTTHAQVPTPWVMPDGNIRVYYACRDTHNCSYPAYFDLSKDLKTVLKVYETSVMERSKPGMFDADGCMPSCVIENNGELWMYYIGWSELKNTARYQNEIGIAVSKDGGEMFQRMFRGSIMGRSPTEPGLAVMPFVMKDKSIFKMWYQSGTGWHLIDGKYEPTYVIKYAESDDGIEWKRFLEQCVKSNHPMEAFSRPCVTKELGGYSMTYCYRDSLDYRGGKGSYRIGFADSSSWGDFIRTDKVNGYKPEGEWDAEMQAYPYFIELDGRRVMFYNGNRFGQTGIGVSIWED